MGAEPMRSHLLRDDWELTIETPNGLQHLPASVPGCVHTDLIAAGVIDDITVDGTEDAQAWIGAADSTYVRTFTRDATHAHATLIFHGLDTLATVTVDGKERLRATNMHRSWAVDVSDVAPGATVPIRVDFAAPLSEAERRRAQLGLYPSPYPAPYNYLRKMACSFGWDWGPTTITSGMWKPVELREWSHVTVRSLSVTPHFADGVGSLRLRTAFLGDPAAVAFRVDVNGPDGLVLSRMLTETPHDITIEVGAVTPWQPRGTGAPTRYQVVLTAVRDGLELERCERTVGFREVSLATEALRDGRHQFTIVLNGDPVQVQGVNWIPPDPFPSRVTRAEYAALLQDAIDANVNLIRVWGGGTYESDAFYELCDELGLLVWQDFLFACAAYPETPDMLAEVEAEAREAVGRLSSHPSLVMWCGGNECIEGYQDWGWQEILNGRPWGGTYYFELLPEIVAELDGTRPYIPGSPFSTHAERAQDPTSGTVHIWDVWNREGYTRYEEYAPAFAAEFGFNGPGSWSSLTTAIHTSVIEPLDPALILHQKAFHGMENLAAGLHRDFGEPPTSGIPWYFATALVQARAVSVGLGHLQSLGDDCSGTILWQLNDMWPALSWAVLDKAGFRKLAWYAVRDAYQPRGLHLGRADYGGQLSVRNRTLEAWDAMLEVVLLDAVGIVRGRHAEHLVVPGKSIRTLRLATLFPTSFDGNFDGFVHVTFGEARAARRTTLLPATVAPAHDLDITSEPTSDGLAVRLHANTYLHDVCLLPETVIDTARVSEQLLSLRPGESRVVNVACAKSDAERLMQDLAEIVWSHNRIIHSTSSRT